MTDKDRVPEENNQEDEPELCKPCQYCGSEMELGIFSVGGDGITRVYIEAKSNQEPQPEYLPLSVCFCRDCGNVELFTGR